MAQAQTFKADALTLEQGWHMPDRGTVGIAFLIMTETVLFTIFVVAYLVYIGKNLSGPMPKDVLDLPILATICLLSSSITIVLAEHALKKEKPGSFKLWWIATIALGLEFLGATGVEWHKLIYKEHLTIRTNLFGTTYYSLVGLRAADSRDRGHGVSAAGDGGDARGISDSHAIPGVGACPWYWHFSTPYGWLSLRWSAWWVEY